MAFDIPFNRPFVVGKELYYIAQAVTFGNLGGDGPFTQRCTRLLEDTFRIRQVLLTPSCTSALELAALLCGLGDGDEVIMPSFTFVSTANAIVRTGARPIFVDIRPDTLNIDEDRISGAVTDRTRAIVPVHYAGVGCEMDAILAVAQNKNLMVIEDAAQGVNAWYKGRALGSLGHIGAYSFHETKNYICGEGGALCVSDPALIDRAHILRDKGTDRQKFLRGEVRKYRWVDVGSSCVPSEIVSAFLFGQLERMDDITERRRRIYQYYFDSLEELDNQGLLRRPFVPIHCTTNYHLFFVILPDAATRDSLASFLAAGGIQAISHYEPLHSSPMGRAFSDASQPLPVTESIADRLLRLPLFYEISEGQQARVVEKITEHLCRGSRNRSHVVSDPEDVVRGP
jgi:dTDP-4-amino-4,6-dideoxygalactose transaminase